MNRFRRRPEEVHMFADLSFSRDSSAWKYWALLRCYCKSSGIIKDFNARSPQINKPCLLGFHYQWSLQLHIFLAKLFPSEF